MPKPTFEELRTGKPSFEQLRGAPVKEFGPRQSPFIASGPGGIVTKEMYPTPSSTSAFMAELPENIGGEVGELTGLTLGGPVGSIVGAFLGGASGKGYEQGVKMFQGTSAVSSVEETPSAGEAYGEMGKAGLRQAGASLVGQGAAKVLSKLAAPFRKTLIPEAKTLWKTATTYGTHPTPGQLTESWLTDTFEKISEASFFGGRRMKRLKLIQQPESARKFAGEIGEMFAQKAGTTLDPDDLGKLVDDVIGENYSTFFKQSTANYTAVDKIAAGHTIDLAPVKNFVTEEIEKTAKVKGVGGSEAGDTLLKQINEIGIKQTPGDTKVDYETANELLKRLKTIERSMGVTRDAAHGTVKHLVNLTEKSIEKSLPEDIFTAKLAADTFHREGKETFSNAIINNIVRTVEKRGEPEKIIPYIFQNKGLSRIQKTKKALGGETSLAWNSLKAKYVEERLFKTKPGEVMGSAISTELTNMGEAATKEIFNPDELALINRAGQYATMITGKGTPNLATGGAMVVQLAQGGAVLGVLEGQYKKLASTVFIVPELFSQMATRPTTAKWLTLGFDTPAHTPEGIALSARLLNAVRQAEQDKKPVAFPSKPFGNKF